VIVAIDGPSASGKSTIGRQLAEHLGLPLVDSGLMYRAVTVLANDRAISPDDEPALTSLAREAELELNTSTDPDPGWRVRASGVDLSNRVFDPALAPSLTRVSQVAGVREALVERQRRYGPGGVVMVGRDIGTVVFPDADLKLYVDASTAERERRRARQLEKRGESLLDSEIAGRDAADQGRAVAPLRPASDARRIDTDGRRPDEVFEEILRLIEPNA
jgi:cytidylate kinase